jgi:UDP-N-acetylmuramyl tripeptide synthase
LLRGRSFCVIRYSIKEARSGDVVILAGKGHEKYEIDKDGVHPFDEAEIVRKAWGEK